MTDENEQALEWVNDKISRLKVTTARAVQSALQPKPSVDVEDLKKNTVSALLKKEVEHVKAKALQQSFSFNKAQGEFEYFAGLVIDHLHSQGHLNQGWRDDLWITRKQLYDIAVSMGKNDKCNLSYIAEKVSPKNEDK